MKFQELSQKDRITTLVAQDSNNQTFTIKITDADSVETVRVRSVHEWRMRADPHTHAAVGRAR